MSTVSEVLDGGSFLSDAKMKKRGIMIGFVKYVVSEKLDRKAMSAAEAKKYMAKLINSKYDKDPSFNLATVLDAMEMYVDEKYASGEKTLMDYIGEERKAFDETTDLVEFTDSEVGEYYLDAPDMQFKFDFDVE